MEDCTQDYIANAKIYEEKDWTVRVILDDNLKEGMVIGKLNRLNRDSLKRFLECDIVRKYFANSHDGIKEEDKINLIRQVMKDNKASVCAVKEMGIWYELSVCTN